MNNIFENIPAELPEEFMETLVEKSGARLERIVSKGHCSPEGFWYDQKEAEWVILLKGAAIIEFAGSRGEVMLNSGDHLLIDAHEKHRVKWTEREIETVWLAVFFN